MVGRRFGDSREPAPLLKKHLGQHHLYQGQICQPLLDFLRPADRKVLEIGPGGGILTRELVAAGAQVWAVDVDLEWVARLGSLRSAGTLSLAVADALDLRWDRLPRRSLVTGNLPFNIATPLLLKILPHHATIDRVGFLVQQEVAERLTAQPGQPAYGSLSVAVALFSGVQFLGRVARGSFRPPPKVDGAFVGFRLREPAVAAAEISAFLRTVRIAFSARRKVLGNALRSGWPRPVIERALTQLGLDSQRRAETLSLEQFLLLHEALGGTESITRRV